MEAAIRGALKKAGIPGAQARRRIYDSARGALDRSLERQGVSDPAQIDEHRRRLEALIAGIEAEWTAPEEPAAEIVPAIEPVTVRPETVRPEMAHAPTARSPQPDTRPGDAPRPDVRLTDLPGPDARRPDAGRPDAGRREPGMGDMPAGASWPQSAAPAAAPDVGPAVRPAVAPGSPPAPARPAAGREASLDFAPDARRPAHSAEAPEFTAERRETGPSPDQPPRAAKPAKAPKPPKAGRTREKKKPRGVFAGMFSAAVMISFLGMGLWWVFDSGLLKSAAERDTSVPNPPPSLSRDDFAGGPQQLNPGSGFSGDWGNVYTPGGDGTPQARGSAEASLVEQPGGTVLRIVSRSGGADGEVLVPLGPEVMQALAGRKSMLALTVRSASPETTQIYVQCAFSVLGDCGRHRFDVGYDTTDVLFTLDYDRVLAPNEGGSLIINSDISGGGKGIDLLAVRNRPLS